MTSEKGFLDAIVREPDVLDHRLVYADWLEEQGDARRAEFLRLDTLLVRLPPGDPARGQALARLRELLPEIGADWLALLDRAAVLNCRRRDCPGRWEKLTLTVTPRVRECATCRKFVQHVRDEREALDLVAAGRCIAVDSRVELPLLALDPLALPDVVEIRDILQRLRGAPRRRRREEPPGSV